MGLSAVRATSSVLSGVNDIRIRGHLLSVYDGSQLKRMTLGLGSGASGLKTKVEGYQMTASGPTNSARGRSMPGEERYLVVPLALQVFW
jgi:hypothetical protein